MLIRKEIEVHKELTELGEGIAAAVAKLLPALSDGAGIDDILVVLNAIRVDILPSLDGARSIATEVMDNHPATAATAGYIGQEILKAVLESK